ncbi:MAG: hypothetical protein ABL917_00580 [Parcubacteria group bacterium]
MKFVLAFAAFALSVTPSFGQEIRVVPYESLFHGLEVVKKGPSLEVVRDGRELIDKTVVEVPSGALHVRHSFFVEGDENSSAHMVVLQEAPTAVLKDADGEEKSRTASLRVLYRCKGSDTVGCMTAFRALLMSGLQMQSLGVSNLEGMSVLPDKDMIFSFYVNSVGKFR